MSEIKIAGLLSGLSKEKKRAGARVDSFHGSSEKNWDTFLEHAQRKSFSKALQRDPRTDGRLARHVDQMNRLQGGRIVDTVRGKTGQYKIVRKRGGGYGCSCPDWRYKQSVAPKGNQDCKHLKKWHEERKRRSLSEMFKRSEAPSVPRLKSTLLPHQERVRRKLRESGGVLVVHGLGSGKTLTSIAAGVDNHHLPMEVVAPAPLVANFEKEVKKHVSGTLPRRVRSYSKVVKDSQPRVEKAKVGGEEDIVHAPAAPLRRNSLLVLDEAHKLRNTGTKMHTHIAIPARDATKRLLLTGTPVYNKPSDLAPLINIAAGEHRLPESPTEFARKFIGKEQVKPGLFQKLKGVQAGEVEVVRNKKILRDAMAGHVDVHDGGTEHFPSRADEEVHVPMSELQHKTYKYLSGQMPRHIRAKIRAGLPPSKQESKDLNAYMAGVRQASLSPRPYHHNMTDEEEEQHVPKLQKAVDLLHARHEGDKNFRGVVYSNFVQAGLNPYSRLLRKKGVKHHVFTGSVSKKERAKMVEDYNTGKVPVLLVSSSGTEGLDLKGTKLMQVMEPHFNNSKIEQVIGRGLRYKSHSHLPAGERQVSVQKFYSTHPKTRLQRMMRADGPMGAEQWLQQRANEKAQVGKQLKELMREAHDLKRVDFTKKVGS